MAQTLSYQLQLAPKLDLQKKKWISAILTAAHDYRLVSAAEAAEAVDNSMSTLKQRTAQLNETLVTQKAKTAEAKVRTAAPIERLLSSRPASQPEHAACARPMHRLTAWGWRVRRHLSQPLSAHALQTRRQATHALCTLNAISTDTPTVTPIVTPIVTPTVALTATLSDEARALHGPRETARGGSRCGQAPRRGGKTPPQPSRHHASPPQQQPSGHHAPLQPSPSPCSTGNSTGGGGEDRL